MLVPLDKLERLPGYEHLKNPGVAPLVVYSGLTLQVLHTTIASGGTLPLHRHPQARLAAVCVAATC